MGNTYNKLKGGVGLIDKTKLTKDQTRALDIMESGKNVFLTGEAGTGKSEVVKIFIDEVEKQGKEILKMAPTGTAADNLHGETIHRVFGANIGIQKNNKKLTERKDILRVADVIIIDEISMCRFDLFEYVARRILYENEMRVQDRENLNRAKLIGYMPEEYEEFPVKENDLQLIVLGDFYQLPPVITQDDAMELSVVYHFDYGKGYAFKSTYWKMMNFHGVVLKEIVRQDDAAFKKILSEVRRADSKNKATCIDFLMRNSSSFPMTGDDSIFLVSTNKKCKETNDRKMAELATSERMYPAKVEGDVNNSDKFADDEILLKDGCKVMLTVNDSSGRFVNGTIGIVKKLRSDSIDVLTENGQMITVGDYLKEITKPILKKKTVKRIVDEVVLDEKGQPKKDQKGNVITKQVLKEVEEESIVHEKVGSFTQLPIRVAYALTTHKSQGKTFNKINLDPYAWEDGQFYTALSRGKRIENIFFIGVIQPKFIKTSDAVKKFMETLEKSSTEIEV